MKDTKTIMTFISGMLTTALLVFLFGEDVQPARENTIPYDPTVVQELNLDEAEDVSVKFVVDGDTVELTNGEKIRFLGIDTPERGKHFYEEATQRLRELVDDRDIRIVKDISETDRYGRLLRHVYVDDIWVNETMIREGFATMVTFPPDVSHVDHFRDLQEDAVANKRGLWQDE